MEPLVRPLLAAWNWIERVGGAPGQMLVGFAAAVGVLAVLNWVASRK